MKIIHFTILATILSLSFSVSAHESSSKHNYTQKKVISSASETDYPPYCIVTQDGKAQGFSVDLLRASLKEMGYKVSFKTGEWNEIKQDLEESRIDVLPLVGRTPEREEVFDFTIPYLTMHGTIVVRENEKNINSFKDLTGKQIAVMKGDNAEEFLRRSKINAEIITTTTFSEALKQLSDGKYDAVVIQKLLAFQLIDKLKIKNIKTVGGPLKEFKQSFCFAVHKGNSELLAILNEGLSIVIAKGRFSNLRQHWFGPIELTEKKVIVVGGDSDAYPYEFLDKNGKPSGCITDLTRAIAKQTGIDIEIRLDKWSNTRKALENHEIDVIQGMFYSIERDNIFDFSLPHHGIDHVIARRKGEKLINTWDELSGKSILVVKGDIMHDIAIQKGYASQLTLADRDEDLLRLLSEGKCDCGIVSRNSAWASIKKNKWENIQLSKSPLHHSEYCYAVNKGNKLLLAVLSEGLEKIKRTGEYNKIHEKWGAPFETKKYTHQEIIHFLLVFVIPLIVLIAVFILWSYTLRKTVATRTEELRMEIEERKKILNSLKESEEKFRMLFNEMLSGFALHEMIFDKDGKPVDYRFLELNPAFERMLELSKKHVLGKTVLEVLPGTEKIWIERYGEVVKTGKEIFFEEHSSELNKTFEVIAYRPIPGHFATIFKDITKQKKAEEEIDSISKFPDENPSPVIRVSNDGILLYSNKASSEIIDEWGVKPGQPLPDRIFKMIHNQSGSAETEFLEISCSKKIYSFIIAPIDGNEYINLYGRDVTEQRKMEEQLRLSEKMQAIGQLAGGIAHDFNNQLSVVLGYADLLLLKLENPDLYKYAESIKKGAQRSAELTKQLLAFSRKGKFETVTVDMNKVIGEVVSMLEHTIDKKIRIKQILNANPASTKGDQSQLYNAILNIAINARDAMPKGGELIFETEITELDKNFCKTNPYEILPGKYVKVSITDNGKGMDSEIQKHIFEPFFTTKKTGMGTGMGLASVYGTIQNHHGAITVYSEVDKGTVFRIFLPLNDEAGDFDEKKIKKIKKIKKGNARILLVDDEQLVRELGADSLRNLGYKVTLCGDGEEAVEYYKKSWKEIDLVILDMIMPKMGGRETFLAMRDINPEIKAVLCSGFSSENESQEILDEGLLGFIAKPFTQSELSEKISSALESD